MEFGFCESQLIIQGEKGEKPLKENTLDRPVSADYGNQNGSGNDDYFTVGCRILDSQSKNQGQSDDGQLAKFHSKVKPEQACEEGARFEVEFRKSSGKPQTVNKAEYEDHGQTIGPVFRNEDILQGNECDAGRNDRLYDIGGQGNKAKGGESQSEGVSNRKNGNLVKERFPLPGEKKKTDHEKNICLLYTSPSPRDATLSRMPSSA